ncbi:MAG TPA: hypothetical protein PLZ72_11135 [Microthrixaceae bacterium]|nr:hypothetical protein [Microthrixaceae bacterium]
MTVEPTTESTPAASDTAPDPVAATTGLTVRYGTVDPDAVEMLGSFPPEQDGPVWMVNLMRYRDRADYADGRDTELTGREADDLYAPLDVLADIGAQVVFFGDVTDQLLGDGPPWDRVAVVKYPTHRSFLEMQTREDFPAHHVHKDAGMEATFIIAGQPFAPPTWDGERPDPDRVPHPSTDEDGPVVVVHVVAFDRDSADTPEALATSIAHMDAYQAHAATVAVPHGVSIDGWFRAEATVVGDGRRWDQVRFNRFPSRAAFMAVVFDPSRLEVQHEHREVAMSDTYTLIVRPQIDTLPASWEGLVDG